MDTLSLTKEARIYNGEKIISLKTGAGRVILIFGKTNTVMLSLKKKKLVLGKLVNYL